MPLLLRNAGEGKQKQRLRLPAAWYEEVYPLVMTNIANWKDPPFLMGKSAISIVIFNSYVTVITRG